MNKNVFFFKSLKFLTVFFFFKSVATKRKQPKKLAVYATNKSVETSTNQWGAL